jgi:hypothetical protein
MHDTIRHSDGNHRAERESEHRKGSVRCADELEPAGQIRMGRHQMEVETGHSPHEEVP